MSIPNAPRYQGKITSWKDEQGFGFITPDGGGPAVFVHIKAFSSRGPRPALDDIVTYHLASNERGQPRAESVAFHRAGATRGATREPSAPGATGAWLTAAGFLGLVAFCVLAGKAPLWILGLYFGASVVTFLAYAIDKSAARKGQWRTQESTLHLFALAGGWPGAMLAQQLLRHKSKKESFRAAFWLTVVANCAALGWFLAGAGANPLRLLAA